MKQVNLEIQLSKLDSLPNPKASLEQYATPSDVAAYLVYRALSEGDIKGKEVADLGCGNGIFAIGVSLMGAGKVYAIDKDGAAISTAMRNAQKLGVEIEFKEGDVSSFTKKVDTVMMNPPFGSQKRDADLPFIEKALEISKVFYILLNYKAGDFLERIVEGRGKIMWSERIEIPIPHTHEFHRKEVERIPARMAKVKVW